MTAWPVTAHALTELQHALGELTPEHWQPPMTSLRIGACFVCFERVHGAGAAGDAGFAGAAVTSRRRLLAGVTSSGPAGGPYLPTLLVLREGLCSSRPSAPRRSFLRCWWSTPPAVTILAAEPGFSFADGYALTLVFAGVALFVAVGALSHQHERAFSAAVICVAC